jgi:hypothetical protein
VFYATAMLIFFGFNTQTTIYAIGAVALLASYFVKWRPCGGRHGNGGERKNGQGDAVPARVRFSSLPESIQANNSVVSLRLNGAIGLTTSTMKFDIDKEFSACLGGSTLRGSVLRLYVPTHTCYKLNPPASQEADFRTRRNQ